MIEKDMEFIKGNIEIVLLAIIIILLLIEPVNKLLRRSNLWTISDKTGYKKNTKQKSIVSIEDKLFEILPYLPDELQNLLAYKEKADDYDRLETDFEKTRKHLETKNSTLLDEKTRLEKELAKEKKETSEKLRISEEKNIAYDKLVNKVRKTEHLKEYAGKVSDYLNFIENIINTANNQCIEFSNKNEEITKIMSVLLQQTLLKTETIAKWKQICRDIQESDIVVLNNTLKNCFQSNMESEQLKELKTKCISELKTYTNAILILCETYSNLSKFIEISEVLNIENDFKNIFAKTISNAKNIGIIEIEKVNIFTNIDNNKSAETDTGQILFPYSTVKNLNKDDIAQIISFGMKSESGDSILKTKVLIQ